MTDADVLDYLRDQHHAVLWTRRRDGGPQLSPVLCAVDDEGRVLVSTRETAMKTANLRRDPAMALCVLPDSFFGRWVQVEGLAEVVTQPEALDLLVDYYRRVSGEHEDWSAYRAAMVAERRVVLRLTVARTGPTVSG